MVEIKEWITTQEAADRLGVSTARIRQMVAENQLAARKVGGKYRGQWQIKSSDVEKRLHEKGVTQTMRVKNRMTPNPIVASLETNYNEALRLMKKNKINHLPIVDQKGRPIGLVTTGGMLRASPSPATTLNAYEMASLLESVTMESIMVSPVLAVDETCSITNAANFMLQNKIDSLLITRDGMLVGIITAADIFRTFVEITGGVQPGTRIEAKLPNQKGHLAPFIQALSNAGSYIVSVTLSNNEDEYGFWDVKERGGNEGEMRKELDKLGYVEVLSFRQSDSDKLLTFGKE
jgi:acetoin utilization protein AcuB